MTATRAEPARSRRQTRPCGKQDLLVGIFPSLSEQPYAFVLNSPNSFPESDTTKIGILQLLARKTKLPFSGSSIGSAVLSALTKLRPRRMLATHWKLRTSSWASYRAVSTGNRSNLPHPTGIEKVKRKQLQRTGPQVKMASRACARVPSNRDQRTSVCLMIVLPEQAGEA